MYLYYVIRFFLYTTITFDSTYAHQLHNVAKIYCSKLNLISLNVNCNYISIATKGYNKKRLNIEKSHLLKEKYTFLVHLVD